MGGVTGEGYGEIPGGHLKSTSGSARLIVNPSFWLGEAPSPMPKLPDTHLHREVMIAIQAETNGVSTALTFAFSLPTSNPEIYAKLKAEIEYFCPNFDCSRRSTGRRWRNFRT